MVERCARAWFVSETGSQHDGDMEWLLFDDEVKDVYQKHARAVIEALMTPTPEMLQAVYEATTEASYVVGDFERFWQAALRTSLSQPNEEGEGK